MAESAKEHLKLTKIAKLLFGDNIVKQLQERGLGVRQIWEMCNPPTQCNNVIGKVVYGTTPCWICGLKITKDLGMTAECEHILPVAQAAIYLKLYNSSMKTADLKGDGWIMNEYGWAHSVCNQEKSDTCPLVIKGDIFKVDEAQISGLLKSILNSKRKDSAKMKANLLSRYRTFDAFKKDRLPKMKERYEQIIDFIANKEKGRSAAAKLITLAGISGLNDIENIRPELHAILNQEGVAEIAAKEREIIENEANRITIEKGVSQLTEIVSLYDDIQDTILLNIPKDFKKIVSGQPKYKEFFQKIRINPNDPVRSLNPENFQSQVFDFIVDIYPIVYTEMSKKGKTVEERRKNTVDVLSKFIVIQIFSGIEMPKSGSVNKGLAVPRDFMKKMGDILNEVKRMLPDDMFKLLSTEYRKHELEEIKPVASILFSMKDIIKNANLRKSMSKSMSMSASALSGSMKSGKHSVGSAAEALSMLRGNTRKSVKGAKTSMSSKESRRKNMNSEKRRRQAESLNKRRRTVIQNTIPENS